MKLCDSQTSHDTVPRRSDKEHQNIIKMKNK